MDHIKDMLDSGTFKPVKGYEDRYIVSLEGDIFSIKRNVCTHGRTKETFKKFKLRPSKDTRGYLVVNLYDGCGRKQKKVHNIVANAFFGKSTKS